MFRLLLFFFFKQKTAYEMRISDWSSDVCSSDLRRDGQRDQREQNGGIAGAIGADPPEQGQVGAERDHRAAERQIDKRDDVRHRGVEGQRRSEERRGGKECVSTCRSRWSQVHEKIQISTYAQTHTTH